MTPAERRSYEASLKAYRDRLAIRAQEEIERKRHGERAKAAREEAWAKARAEREALATAICTKEAALRMIALGIPVEKTAEILQMTEEQIAA